MNPSPLHQRMLDALHMRGYSPRTIKSYVYAVKCLCRFYHRSPERITPQEIQDWLLWQVREKQISASTCRLTFNGVRFLYVEVLSDADFAHFAFTLPKAKQRIPELLTIKEVALVLMMPSNPGHRVLLGTCYGCGLRLSELIRIRLQDIDAQQQLLHIIQGKGGKDRLVPIPRSLLPQWRKHWQTHHSRNWLFPSTHHRRDHLALGTPQKIYTKAKRAVGIKKNGGIHALRHAFATHSLQSGMPIHQLQQILGHRHITTTIRYLHWLPEASGGQCHIDLLKALPAIQP